MVPAAAGTIGGVIDPVEPFRPAPGLPAQPLVEHAQTPVEHAQAQPGEGPSQADAAQAPTLSEEIALLDGLEADLAAVEAAIDTLDRISAEGHGGEHAANEIAAAVSTERFGA